MLSGAVVLLAVNVAVGTLFGASYVVLAFANRGQRRAVWLGVPYFLGNMAPAGDLVASFVGHAAAFDLLGDICFTTGLASMALAFSYFQRQPIPWKAFFAVVFLGLVIRLNILHLAHQTLAYGFGYQLPFALASFLSAGVVFRIARRRAMYRLLGVVFAITALHFLLKPFLMVRYGAASSAQYTHTVYALLSQASTGILLFACAIVLLIVVAQKAITDSQLESVTDALSGLLNRRGFDNAATALLASGAATGAPVTAIIFDIDHFKSINDTHGHAVGDKVIAGFAGVLRETMPPGALLGRIGGEEFAVLLNHSDEQTAFRYAEQARLGFSARLQRELQVSVSGGVAAYAAGDSVPDLMMRADRALYTAKSGGRDQVVPACPQTLARLHPSAT